MYRSRVSLKKELENNFGDIGYMVTKKSSKKLSSGGGSFQPLLGLGETADLQAEVTRWQAELEVKHTRSARPPYNLSSVMYSGPWSPSAKDYRTI